jgi:hypothetical protein
MVEAAQPPVLGMLMSVKMVKTPAGIAPIATIVSNRQTGIVAELISPRRSASTNKLTFPKVIDCDMG